METVNFRDGSETLSQFIGISDKRSDELGNEFSEILAKRLSQREFGIHDALKAVNEIPKTQEEVIFINIQFGTLIGEMKQGGGPLAYGIINSLLEH